jgi:hypothetical protein
MFFKQRELKPYSEPVLVTELEQDGVYFSLNYVDEEMLLPAMEPVVFIGRNLGKEDVDHLYFQDITSYGAGVRYSSDNDVPATFFVGAADKVRHIFEFEQALSELMRCSLRRTEARIRRVDRNSTQSP